MVRVAGLIAGSDGQLHAAIAEIGKRRAAAHRGSNRLDPGQSPAAVPFRRAPGSPKLCRILLAASPGVVDQAGRIGRPTGTIVIDVILGQSQWSTARQQPDPDLASATGHRNERNGFPVRRNGRSFLKADQIGEPTHLNIPRGGWYRQPRVQKPTCEAATSATGKIANQPARHFQVAAPEPCCDAVAAGDMLSSGCRLASRRRSTTNSRIDW